MGLACWIAHRKANSGEIGATHLRLQCQLVQGA